MSQNLAIIVSDYLNQSSDSDTATAPLTYFVAGAPRGSDDEPPVNLRGDELVAGTKFKDDLRDPVSPNQQCITSDGAGTSILAQNTAAQRAALSGGLLTNGGWREHTDGNRISTTRGDSVEVVYGNYKLVVLGRISKSYDPTARGGLGDAGNTTTNTTLSQVVIDSSGGHNTQETSTGGRVISATWDDGTEDGSWKTLEQTDDGDKRTVFKGRVERTFFGPRIERRIGKGADEVSIDSGNDKASAHKAKAPAISLKTFARSLHVKERSRKLDEQTVVKKDVETKVTAFASAKRAQTWETRGETILTAGFRETLSAQTIERQLDASYRFSSSVGVLSFNVSAIGYQQTLLHGTRVDLWVKGGELQVDGVRAGLKIGTDSAYRMGPSVDLAQAMSIRVHATLDALAPLSWVATRLVKKKDYVFDGDVVVIKVKNAAYSSTV